MKKNNIGSNHDILYSGDFLMENLIRLGFSFEGKSEVKSPDLEKVILSVCSNFVQEMKIFKMLLAWVDHGTKQLIHVERLRALYDGLPENSATLDLGLYIVCSRLFETDRRFKLLIDPLTLKIHQNKLRCGAIASSISDSYMIEKHGLENGLKNLGVHCYRIPKADDKKLQPVSTILSNNVWLKFRVFVGANYRSDLLYFKFIEKVPTAYRAWKCVGCAQETAYRIWNELELIADEKIWSI